jgi:hydroxyacylglutathione hydrolase
MNIMPVITIKVGPLQTNCYLYYIQDSKQSIIIDPGDEASKIIKEIKQNQLKPTAIITTHGHWDHLLAINDLKKKFPKLPYYLSKKDHIILKNSTRDAKRYANMNIKKLSKVDHFWDKMTEIEVGNSSSSAAQTALQIIPTPGHTQGGIILYSPTEEIAFTGDTIFAQGYLGRTDLEGGNSQELAQSIKKIFQTLPAETKIYPGHGDSSTIQTEMDIHQYRKT